MPAAGDTGAASPGTGATTLVGPSGGREAVVAAAKSAAAADRASARSTAARWRPRREHTVVHEKVDAGLRNENREFVEEPSEDQGAGAVARGCFGLNEA